MPPIAAGRSTGTHSRAVTPSELFYLCNPHNPVARVWRRDELVQLGEFCVRHDLLLCSNEIHCDLILDDLPHIPTALLGEEVAKRTESHSWRRARSARRPHMGTSMAIIPDAQLRARFHRAAAGVMAEVAGLGYVACEAAYRDSEPWRRGSSHLRGNRDFLLDIVARELPGVTVEAPIEAAYLAWLNVSALQLPDPIAHFKAHGVGLSDGTFSARRAARTSA